MTKNKLYWVLQIAGWGLVGMVMLLFAHIYDVQIPTHILLWRIVIVFFSGIAVTHILRFVIKWGNMLLLPLEKALPRLIISVISASLLFSLIVT
ncbi:MAG TPA: hypothetical protein PLU37_03670, partial [Chitinophagaceae bacterium]|nr:hypothetical protein [Chitinophagaceae bacterium]